MLRLGVSLPALMQLLGHKDIHMTLLYLDVTQQDLQREFHCARQKAASLHPIPKLPLPQATTPELVNLPAIRNAIAVGCASMRETCGKVPRDSRTFGDASQPRR
jgi:hypothetical protein